MLIWTVIVSCGAMLLRAARFRATRAGSGWVKVAAGILVSTLALLWLRPSIAGYVGGAGWALLLLVPMVATRKLGTLVMAQRYTAARRVAHIISVLHPADGWRDYPRLLKALELGQEGELDAALTRLAEFEKRPGPTGRLATMYGFRLRQAWEEGLDWVRRTAAARDPDVQLFYIRALGETGQLAAMLNACHHSTVDAVPLHRAMSRLYVFSFGGRVDMVDRLFRGPLAASAEAHKLFWRITAMAAAGRSEAAREAFSRFSETAAPGMRRAIERRLGHPPLEAAKVLAPDERALLDVFVSRLDDEALVEGAMSMGGGKPVITRALVALNVAAFGFELATGATGNLQRLYEVGMMFPPAVLAGDWWRLLTAIFLHAGITHLTMNMLGLWLLGPFVERAMGRIRMLAVYFLSGLGSELWLILLSLWPGRSPQGLVGASGCIMGLVGATAAILWRASRRGRSLAARRKLLLVAIVIALQIVFDLTTPEISFAGHLSGVILGVIIGLPLSRVGSRTAVVGRPAEAKGEG